MDRRNPLDLLETFSFILFLKAENLGKILLTILIRLIRNRLKLLELLHVNKYFVLLILNVLR